MNLNERKRALAENDIELFMELADGGVDRRGIHDSVMNSIHETLKMVWSREYSADDGLEEIEIALMGYEFCPALRRIPPKENNND